jgi:hypothetical protein
MIVIPRRFAPYIYGMIQAAITSAIASAIATNQLTMSGLEFAAYWLKSWGLAWLTMLPIVVLIAPYIQRAVIAMTVPDE